MVETPPNDMFVRQQQFVRTVYRDVYPAIDPTSPKLSQAGKVVIVSGATQGLGAAIALGFAKAKAAGIVLVSRSEVKLQATKDRVLKINPDTKVLVVPTDVSSPSDVANVESAVRSAFGCAHVLVNCAGQWTATTVRDSDPDAWWKDFEVNVRGPMLITQAFLRLLGTERPGSVINITSHSSLYVYPGCSSYGITKTALNKLTEYIAAENPNVKSTALNPGTVPTAMVLERPMFTHFAEDTPELTAGLAVYLASDGADYLNGRYVSANWSVEELETKKEEIVAKDLLKFALKGEFGSQLFD